MKKKYIKAKTEVISLNPQTLLNTFSFGSDNTIGTAGLIDETVSDNDKDVTVLSKMHNLWDFED